MDLETFFTTLYVLIDDWYTAHLQPLKPKHGGPKPHMSDSEVLTVAIAGQWRGNVPWQSERGLVRYLQAHGRAMFPRMLQRSAFNQRVRRLWGMFVQLQQVVAAQLETEHDLYEVVDCLPVPAGSLGQYNREQGHWLWTSTIGRGAGGWFWGDHLLASVTRSGAITGWLLAAADINDRWLMELLVSSRAGCPQLIEPARRKKDARSQYRSPPVGFMGALQAVGNKTDRPYLADRGFHGERWIQHWATRYGAVVLAPPPPNVPHPWTRAWKSWHRRHRQIIETVFATLVTCFGIKQLQAHSRWGQYTRIAAKMAAYNIGLYLNRLLARPAHAFATLIC